jgi:hypothetical protein
MTKNLRTKFTKNIGTKIWEQKFKKREQNPGTKFQKTRNKNYKNLKTKNKKIRELKLQKSGNKSYKKLGTKI